MNKLKSLVIFLKKKQEEKKINSYRKYNYDLLKKFNSNHKRLLGLQNEWFNHRRGLAWAERLDSMEENRSRMDVTENKWLSIRRSSYNECEKKIISELKSIENNDKKRLFIVVQNKILNSIPKRIDYAFYDDLTDPEIKSIIECLVYNKRKNL